MVAPVSAVKPPTTSTRASQNGGRRRSLRTIHARARAVARVRIVTTIPRFALADSRVTAARILSP